MYMYIHVLSFCDKDSTTPNQLSTNQSLSGQRCGLQCPSQDSSVACSVPLRTAVSSYELVAHLGPMSRPTKFVSGWCSWGMNTLSSNFLLGGLCVWGGGGLCVCVCVRMCVCMCVCVCVHI